MSGNNNDTKKTSLYLSLENYKKIKKASYFSLKSMTDIINEILDNNLDDYVKNLEIND
jgi:hypothetical protein